MQTGILLARHAISPLTDYNATEICIHEHSASAVYIPEVKCQLSNLV